MDDLADVGALVRRNFILQALVAPEMPVIEENAPEMVVTGGGVRALPRGWGSERRLAG